MKNSFATNYFTLTAYSRVLLSKNCFEKQFRSLLKTGMSVKDAFGCNGLPVAIKMSIEYWVPSFFSFSIY